MKLTVPFVGGFAGHAIVGCVNVPGAIVGTPAGHAIVGCVNVPDAMVGTPAGHAIVGCVNCPAAMVGGFAGHAIVPAGVPGLFEVVAPVEPGAAPPTVEKPPLLVPLKEPLPVAMEKVVEASAEPVNVGTFTGHEIAPSVNAPPEFVGTPAGHEIAPSENAPLEFVGTPAGHDTAPSENAPPEFTGTFNGHEIVSAGTVPGVPVNVGAATVPAGVNATVPFVPTGV